MKYEVRFNNWEGMWEEVYFEGSEAECEKWVEEHDGDLNDYEEYYSVVLAK